MKIYAVRHGQSENNVMGLNDSDPNKNYSLTLKGIEQAKSTALELKSVKLDIMYSSELERAKETAKIINKYHNNKIILDSRLNDRKTGFQDKSYDEFFPRLRQSNDVWAAKFNDGESFEEEKQRVFSFLDDLKNKNYNSLLIASHKEILQIIHSYVHKCSNEEMVKVESPNGAIMQFDL